MTLRDHKLLAFMDVSVGNRGRMLLRKSAEIDAVEMLFLSV